MSTKTAAEYLDYAGKHPARSVYKFIARHCITTRRDGRRLLLARADVERALNGLHVSQSRRSSHSSVNPFLGKAS